MLISLAPAISGLDPVVSTVSATKAPYSFKARNTAFAPSQGSEGGLQASAVGLTVAFNRIRAPMGIAPSPPTPSVWRAGQSQGVGVVVVTAWLFRTTRNACRIEGVVVTVG